MKWRLLTGCSLATMIFSPIAHAQLGNGNFNYNRVTDSSYYNRAEVDNENNEFFVRNRYQDVNDRWQEGYNPVPIRFGAFEALPSLRLDARATDNLFLDDQNSVEDIGFSIEPSVTTQSTWSRHKIGFDARVNRSQFIEATDESATTGGARAFGILDVTSDFAFGGSVAYQKSREPRVSFGGVLGAAERIESDRVGAEVNSIYQRNRVKVRSRLSYNDYDFKDVELIDGTFADQDFRDFSEVRGAVRTDYAITRDFAIVGEVEYVDRDASGRLGPNGFDRSISGVAVRAGTNFELARNLRGDILVGYQTFDSQNPGVSNIDGVALRADLTWFPSQLTTIRFGAGRDVEDAGNVDAASVVATRADITASHEFRRNIIGFANASYRNFDFEPSNINEDEFGIIVGGTYKANEHAHVTLRYGFRDRSSDIQPFQENSLRVSLTLYP